MKIHVLVIEDGQAILGKLAQGFRDLGCEVFCAADQCHAMTVFRALRGRVDIVVSDVHVPRGIEGVEAFRSNDYTNTEGLVREFRNRALRLFIYLYSADREDETLAMLTRTEGMGFRVIPSGKNATAKANWVIADYRRNFRPKAFIVHGHDHKTRNELCQMIEVKFLFDKPTVLDDEPGGLRTIIEKFEEQAELADVAFIIMTPDDEFRKTTGNNRIFRARQNVILEMGYLMSSLGRHSGRVIVLRDPRVDEFSDFAGVVWISLEGGLVAARERIERELRAAGLIGWTESETDP